MAKFDIDLERDEALARARVGDWPMLLDRLGKGVASPQERELFAAADRNFKRREGGQASHDGNFDRDTAIFDFVEQKMKEGTKLKAAVEDATKEFPLKRAKIYAARKRIADAHEENDRILRLEMDARVHHFVEGRKADLIKTGIDEGAARDSAMASAAKRFRVRDGVPSIRLILEEYEAWLSK